ncbi:FAD-dependent oxidoreductase, partial [Cutibacterium acnes]
MKSSPSIIFFNEGKEVCTRLSGYISHTELKDVVEKIMGGICTKKGKEKIRCDVAILGAGPAGLSAAIYAARAKLHVVIIDEGMP